MRAKSQGFPPQVTRTAVFRDGSVRASEQNRLALLQALGFRVLHGQCRDAVQHGLEGAENPFMA